MTTATKKRPLTVTLPSQRRTPTPEQLAGAPGMVRAAHSKLPRWDNQVATLREWKVFLKATKAAFEEEIAQLEKDLEDGDLYYQTKMQHERRLVQLRENLDAVVNGDSMLGEYPLIIKQANLPEAVRAHHGYGTKHIDAVITKAKAERDKYLAIIDDWMDSLPEDTPTSKHVLRQTKERHID
jgi:hypothetical protein